MNDNTEAGGQTARQRFFSNSRRKTKQTKFGDLDLIVKELSSAAIAKFVPMLNADSYEEKQRAAAEMAVLCTFDLDGNPVFEADDAVKILNELGTGEFGDFVNDVLEINARTKKAQDEIEKNSPAQTSDLLSD